MKVFINGVEEGEFFKFVDVELVGVKRLGFFCEREGVVR